MLIQTDKIRHFPVVLVGTEYWAGLVDWMRERLVAEAMIAPDDLDLLHGDRRPRRGRRARRGGAQRQGLQLAAQAGTAIAG